MSRRVVAILFCALALSSCGWAMQGFNAARTSYNASEGTIGLNNVSSLARAWSAQTGGIVASPIVAGGYAYVADIGGTVYAFDADGIDGCTGTPADCEPLWTAQLDHSALRPPTVANGVLYISAAGDTGIGGKLYAFDANGETACSGSPKVCTPLWTALNVDAFAAPTVAYGHVYVSSHYTYSPPVYRLLAFDAAGETNCSGVPKVCKVLWWADLENHQMWGPPAVANGRLYVGVFPHFYAFDVAGTACVGGYPKKCNPLWTGSALSSYSFASSPVIANGRAYIVDIAGNLYVYDAAGVERCAGAPKTCDPLWTASVPDVPTATVQSSPAVANGKLYVGSDTGVTGARGRLDVFDATGTTGCSGEPKVCAPLRRTDLADAVVSSPSVANGVVYVGTAQNSFSPVFGDIYAIDADGTINCTPGTPTRCEPIWSDRTSGAIETSPAIADGRLYVATHVWTGTYPDVGELIAYALSPP